MNNSSKINENQPYQFNGTYDSLPQSAYLKVCQCLQLCVLKPCNYTLLYIAGLEHVQMEVLVNFLQSAQTVQANKTTVIILCQSAHEGGKTCDIGLRARLGEQDRESHGMDTDPSSPVCRCAVDC